MFENKIVLHVVIQYLPAVGKRFSDNLGCQDLGCLFQILIFIHPGSRIPDLGSHNSIKREKFVVLLFFAATNITKLLLSFF
jgi:hypothetical protein